MDRTPERLKKELEEELLLSSEDLRSHAWYHGRIPRQVCALLFLGLALKRPWEEPWDSKCISSYRGKASAPGSYIHVGRRLQQQYRLPEVGGRLRFR